MFSKYELKKWFDEYGRFEAPEFLAYGDELGEAYDSLVRVEESSTYLGDALIEAVRREILDIYYYQVHLFDGSYGGYDTAEDFGLPPAELVIDRYKRYFERTKDIEESYKLVFDWAMKWRDKHREETETRNNIKRLEEELARFNRKQAASVLISPPLKGNEIT